MSRRFSILPGQRPGRISNALTGKHVAADTNLAQFVRFNAYESAGRAKRGPGGRGSPELDPGRENSDRQAP
jgi:hypothetical protein